MNNELKYEMIQAMRRYGGGFVAALAECFKRADAENLQRLLKAFPEYVEQYCAIAGIESLQEKDPEP